MSQESKAAEKNQGALSNLRVLEMGSLIAGPFCGQLLGDMGAEVIKIEPPKVGDPMRQWGRSDQAVWWPIIARNKKSITLDLRNQEGQDIVKELIKEVDIIIENFRPGTMKKWGLDYEALKAINPGIIMVSVSGYGQTGPYSSRAGYGGIAEAMGGLRFLCGDPSTPPSRMGISIGDSLAANFACMGALAAVNHRHITGEGQWVDVAIYEAVLAMMESTVPEYSIANYTRHRTGAILPQIAPSNVYPCKDGDLLIGANQDTVYKRLCEAMQRPDLITDEKFFDHTQRGVNQQELDDIISEWTQQFTLTELEKLMEDHGVPAGKMYRAKDMLEDPQFQARDAIVDVKHPQHENLKMQNVFPKLSKTPGSIRWPGATLGQHNREVYKELLKLSDEEIDAMESKQII